MGLYYKSSGKKNTNVASYILMGLPVVVLLILILPFLKPVQTIIYGVFGLAVYLGMILMFLIGLAKFAGRRFYMSAKNIVYVALSAFFVLALLHAAFFGGVADQIGGIRMSNYGAALKAVVTGSAGVTVGGVILTAVIYPILSLLGLVGSSLTFGILAVVALGLTVDYYVNLKALYDRSRVRRETYKNSTPLPSTDTIEGSLSMLSNASDVVPKKLDSVDYDSYYENRADLSEEPEVDTNSIVETEPSVVDDFNNRFFGNIQTSSDYEDNLSNDELAKSKYDPEKFSSVTDYITHPYVPKMFSSTTDEQEESQEATETFSSYLDSSREEEPEEEKNNFTSANTPFIFNSFENNFVDNQDRSRRFEPREQEEDITPESPFAGYTSSASRRCGGNLRAEAELSEEARFNSPLNFSPKPEATQTELPGVRNKPKKYSQEQDAKYNPPPTTLLESRPDDPSKYGADYEEKSRALEEVLSSFKIDAKVRDVTRGPSVTQYELAMPFGISVKRVLQYDGDIAAALRSKKGIRIEAPIAGKNAVGVEVPNDSPSTVGLRELLESPEFTNSKAVLPFVVGKNIYGETIIKSLPKMVHMLVAGSTGSGKSVFLHSILLSLMYKCSPAQLRFILIDPKRVEFTIYSGMPHMMLPNAVSNCEKAINALGWAVKEMERRFDTFQTLSVQNIEDYNHCEAVKRGEYPKIAYIVIVIDELNELMMTGKKEVEEKITRLSQLGRASGIHMIIATQRPSADVVTGTIKNNLPTRVAFALQSGIDSRVILDEIGAEKLLGRGDMLMAPYDDSVTSRVQGAFMSMDEVRKVVQYIKDHNDSFFDEEIAKEILADKPTPQEEPGSSIAGNLEPDEDELLPAALKLCIDSGGASINMIQRRFRVGYARAARIIDQMELAGYISAGNGSKLRTVYISLDEYREKFGEEY